MAGFAFVSYSRRDSTYAMRLVDFLRGHNVDVWVDADVNYGDRWEAVIKDRVDSCAALVVVMTPDAEDSVHVANELSRARSKGKPILPLLLEGEAFYALGYAEYDDVRDSSMPSQGFVDRLRKAVNGGFLRSLVGHQDHVTDVAWAPDGKRLASVSFDGTARIWASGSGWQLRSLGHDSPLLTVTWSPDATRLITGGLNGVANFWDLNTGKMHASGKPQVPWVTSVAWSRDANHIAIAEEGYCQITSLDTAITHILKAQRIYRVCFSPNSRLLAMACGDAFRIWETRSGDLLRTVPGHGYVSSVAWAPDGKRLATAGADGVRIWDAESAEHIRTLTGHSKHVSSVAWSGDGGRLATGSGDHTARVWDPNSGAHLLTLDSHTDTVGSVAWAAQARLLATASHDHTIGLWEID